MVHKSMIYDNPKRLLGGEHLFFQLDIGFMSSLQLTFTHIFQRGGVQTTTQQIVSTISEPRIPFRVGSIPMIVTRKDSEVKPRYYIVCH